MTERDFSEQRDRGNRTPESVAGRLRSGLGEDWEHLVFDETFVRAAPTKELSARNRMLEARRVRESPAPELWRPEQPPVSWSVKPSRRLAAMRISALAWIVAAVSGAALVVGFLLH
jgi:hypothetical protein